MITKSIIKDYAHRRCPYLTKASLDDNSLLKLIENFLEFGTKEDLEEAIEDSEGSDDNDNPNENTTLDIVEIMRDYPYLRGDIEKLIVIHAQENPLYGLLKKYEDTQVTARLSRRYIELIYGKDVCKRCDVNDFGVESLNQAFIVARTKEYLADPNVKVLFEGQVEHGNLRARFDVLVKEDDGTFTLIEAKGSNSALKHPKGFPEIDTGIKEGYLYDLAFQYYIYDKEGINISKLGYLHLNKDFTYGDGANYPDLSDDLILKLFKLTFALNYRKPRSKAEPIELPIKEYLDKDMYVETTKDGENKIYQIEELIYIVDSIRKGADSKAFKHYYCVKGGKCPFLLSCFSDAEDHNSIFKLTRWSHYNGTWTKTKKLMDAGVMHISEVPTDIVNSYHEEEQKDDLVIYGCARMQLKFENEWKNKPFNYVVHKKLLNEILYADYDNENIDYLVFFDFESIQNPVPLMKDAHPWQQIVTQYSMHIVKKGYDLTKHDFASGRGGGCSHYEFIGHPSKDKYENPEFELFRVLKRQLEDFGMDPMAKNYRVVVFNENFEKTRMKEFVRLYTSHKNTDAGLLSFVQNFNDNVVDLLHFFTYGSIYGRDFKGKGSLKIVQPTLCQDPDVLAYYKSIGLPFDFANSLDYHKEGALVYNGGICLDLYKALLVRNHINPNDNDPDEQEMLNQALAYCKIDSWGTVIIYDILKHVSDGKIKLKALML